MFIKMEGYYQQLQKSDFVLKAVSYAANKILLELKKLTSLSVSAL